MSTRVSASAAAAVTLAVCSSAFAQTGLFHDARDLAADVAAAMRAIVGSGNPDGRWIVGGPVIDDFSDARGRVASTVGRNERLVLMVGCSDGQLTGVAIGGLGGVREGRRRTPNVIFRDGDVDIRWGEESITSQTWADGDEVLALVNSAGASDFWAAAQRSDRLRMRATTMRGVIQDEFDLRNVEVTTDAVRVTDTGNTPEVLTCRR